MGELESDMVSKRRLTATCYLLYEVVKHPQGGVMNNEKVPLARQA
jgi:hypothetical protein